MMVAMVNQMHLSNTKSWYKGLSVPESCQTYAVHVIGKGRCSCRLQSQGTPPFFIGGRSAPPTQKGGADNCTRTLACLSSTENDQDEGYR